MLIIAAIILLFAPTIIYASDSLVRIQEFSTVNGTDWVRLYNSTGHEINLENYSLVDGSSSGNMKSIECVLSPHGFVTIEWGQSLNKDGDKINLKRDEEVVDCVSYGDIESICEGKDTSDLPKLATDEYGKKNDGGTWEVVKDRIKEENSSCIEATPIPLPTPTPIDSPTPTKAISTPTNKPKPTNTLVPTRIKSTISETKKVLGATQQNDNETEQASQSSELKGEEKSEQSKEKGSGRWVFLTLSVVSMLAAAGYAVLIYKGISLWH